MYQLRSFLLVFLRVLLVVLAVFSVVLTARLIIIFFGVYLKTFPLRLLILNLAKGVTISFVEGGRIKTPYKEGFFELNTVFTLLLFLLLEPALERVRRSVLGWHPARKAPR